GLAVIVSIPSGYGTLASCLPVFVSNLSRRSGWPLPATTPAQTAPLETATPVGRPGSVIGVPTGFPVFGFRGTSWGVRLTLSHSEPKPSALALTPLPTSGAKCLGLPVLASTIRTRVSLKEPTKTFPLAYVTTFGRLPIVIVFSTLSSGTLLAVGV